MSGCFVDFLLCSFSMSLAVQIFSNSLLMKSSTFVLMILSNHFLFLFSLSLSNGLMSSIADDISWWENVVELWWNWKKVLLACFVDASTCFNGISEEWWNRIMETSEYNFKKRYENICNWCFSHLWDVLELIKRFAAAEPIAAINVMPATFWNWTLDVLYKPS